MTEDGRDEVGSFRKMAIHGTDADARPGGDLPHRSVHSRSREYRQRRFQQRVHVPLRVGAYGLGLRRLVKRVIALSGRPRAHSQNFRLQNGTVFRINTEGCSA